MIDFIYKPKGERIWRWKFRQEPKHGKIQDVSLGTSDKRCAEERQKKLRKEKEQECAGLIAPKAVREAAQRNLVEHLADFLGDMRRRGKSEKYLDNLEFRNARLFKECGWKLAQDVTADSFQAWLRKQIEMKDKTANDYLEAVRCFFNWLVKLERAASNPLRSIEKVKTKEGLADKVRAFSNDEMKRLLVVAGERKPIYLMAVHTGLRAGELGALKWIDLHLDALVPFVRVRASTTKNGKSAEMRLHPELVKALRELKGNSAKENELVFKRIPRIERFRRDLNKAGIPLADTLGRKAVFHSLRHTFGTNLARAGVASRVAMALMRHSDRRLLDDIYTDENLLGTSSAIDVLPSYGVMPSQIASQEMVAPGQIVSLPVTTNKGEKGDKPTANIGESHILSLPVAMGQNMENGGSGGARTRNLCRDRAAL